MVSRHVSSVVGICTALVLIAGMTGSASAAIIVYLDDLNSQVEFSPSSGVISWTVDDVQQLKQQWFFYRFSGTTQETPLSSLGYVKHKASNADYDAGNEMLSVLYGNTAGFSVTVSYVLSGGMPGSRQSDLQETITFNNKTSQAVKLQFYQYVDFDLNGTPDDDTVELMNANTVRQSDGFTTVAETVVTPAPLHTETATYAATLVKLNDGSADNLNDPVGPLGPADVTWAFQWDLTVAAGGTVQISKDKNITPEPATIGLMGVGLAAAAVSRYRKSRRCA